MEIKVYLEIGKKLKITKIEKWWKTKKKVVCKTARRAHSQKFWAAGFSVIPAIIAFGLK